MQAWRVKDSGVIHQDFSGEVVVIDLASGNYFSLPGSGGLIWRRMAAGGASAAELTAAITALYDVEHDAALADVSLFLADLEREGLVVAGGAGITVEPAPSAGPRSAYVAPRLDVYRDLQDLLLLDPVHEVDPAAGWPRAVAPEDDATGTTVRLSAADLVAAGVDTTVVVVNRDRGTYCRLDGAAARAWRCIETGSARICGSAFVRQLLEGGFLEPVGPDEAPGATIDVPDGGSIHDDLCDQIRPWGNRRRPLRSPQTRDVQAMCDRLDAWFEAAARDRSLARHTVAGHRIAVESPAGSDVAALSAALPPDQSDSPAAPSLLVRAWRGAPSAAAPLLANLAESLRASWGTLCGPRGEVVDLHTDATSAIFDPGGNVLSVIDRSRGRAWAVKIDDRPFPFWEAGAPFRFILHDHFSRHGLQLVHGAAVADDQGALLVVGKGGSGKSSTALAAAAHGLRYLGDDYCLVDDAGTVVHAIYRTGKLVGSADFTRLPEYRGHSINADSFERGGAGKGVFLVDAVCPGALASRRDLRAIALPRIESSATSSGRAGTRVDALVAIFPSTVGQLPGAGPADAGRVERLVANLPTYVLHVGNDPGSAVEAIRGILAACTE